MKQPLWFHRYLGTSTLAIYSAVVALVLLWPFDLDRNFNGVSVGSAGGAEFRSEGILQSVALPDALVDRLRNAGGMTVETRLSTFDPTQTGPARILSYSLTMYRRNFTLAQSETDLVWRVRRRPSNPYGFPQIKVPGVFGTTRSQHLVVSYDLRRHRVFVDGEMVYESPVDEGSFRSWSHRHRLLVGNEVTGDRPWLGRIEGFRIFDRALTASEIRDLYLHRFHLRALIHYEFATLDNRIIDDQAGIFSGLKLYAPPTFWTLAFYTLKPRHWTDALFNALVFVPWGFLLFGTLDSRLRRPVWLMAAMFLLIPVIFEGLQCFIEGRTSSAWDLLSQLLGCVFGAVLYKRLGRTQNFRDPPRDAVS